jgi:methyl-accepting chemotaxis protein
MKNTSIRTKFIISHGLLLFSFLAISALIFYITRSQEFDALKINLGGRQRMLTQKMTKEALLFKLGLYAKESVYNTSEVFDKTLKSLTFGGIAPLDLELKNLKYLPQTTKSQIKLQLRRVINLWTSFRLNLNLVLENKSEKALKYLTDNNLRLLTEMNKAVLMMQKESDNKNSVVVLSIITGIGFTLVIFIVSILISKSVTGRVLYATSLANEISKRNLTFEINDRIAKKTDEVGNLIFSVSKIKTNFLSILEDMNKYSESLNSSVKDISLSANTVSETAASQAATVEETSASMEELTASITRVSDNTEAASDRARNFLKIAEDSQALVNTTITSISKITENSEEISVILEVINDISDQTNLLALNAAIEAARAGEAGKGFSVVADEISKLADKSSDNATKIAKLIKQNVNDTNLGTENVKKTGEAFNVIISNVEETSILLSEITSAIAEQRIGAEQVTYAVEDISSVTQSNSDAADNLAASMEDINSLAAKIKEKISLFKMR